MCASQSQKGPTFYYRHKLTVQTTDLSVPTKYFNQSVCSSTLSIQYVPYKGAGNDEEPLAMAWPTSRGQVINFSRKLVMPLMKLKQASNGCSEKKKNVRLCNDGGVIKGTHRGRTWRSNQRAQQMPAIGHATKTRRTIHNREKTKLAILKMWRKYQQRIVNCCAFEAVFKEGTAKTLVACNVLIFNFESFRKKISCNCTTPHWRMAPASPHPVSYLFGWISSTTTTSTSNFGRKLFVDRRQETFMIHLHLASQILAADHGVIISRKPCTNNRIHNPVPQMSIRVRSGKNQWWSCESGFQVILRSHQGSIESIVADQVLCSLVSQKFLCLDLSKDVSIL